MDEALGLPSEEAATLALRTQQVLAFETGVADTVDPLGGSPFVETLTDEVERRAQESIDKIDKLGGAVKAIAHGWYQSEIHRSALEHQRAVEEGRTVIVGVNRFETEEPPPKPFRVDARAKDEVLADLAELRATRDGAKAESSLARLESAARTDANLMPHLIDCVESRATIGEICARLERVFGKQSGDLR
jgi:methylmalonyl-CoA mutase N-terminal domain/subunit